MTDTNLDGQSRRITRRLLAYWEAAKGDRPFPALTDIQPEMLSDIWDACFLVQVKHTANPGEQYKYIYLGPSIIAAYGNEATGGNINTSLLSKHSGHITDVFDKVVDTGKPLVEESEFRNLNGIMVRYRQCVLPLGEFNDDIDHLLGGMKWKAE